VEGAVTIGTDELRPGDTVWVRGREATFLYSSGSGAVVRYRGERGSRVVALYKLRRVATA
jgi:hypothetical protein